MVCIKCVLLAFFSLPAWALTFVPILLTFIMVRQQTSRQMAPRCMWVSRLGQELGKTQLAMWAWGATGTINTAAQVRNRCVYLTFVIALTSSHPGYVHHNRVVYQFSRPTSGTKNLAKEDSYLLKVGGWNNPETGRGVYFVPPTSTQPSIWWFCSTTALYKVTSTDGWNWKYACLSFPRAW